jgi:hypothetical protein
VTDTVLVIAWLVLAHLLADFVFQNDWIALNKGLSGRRGLVPLLVHGLLVSICLLPVALAYGARGVAYIVVIALSHVLVDRWKVYATRRAEATAQAEARRRIGLTGEAPPSGMGAAWTPWPGLLFLGDQALHLTFVLVGWLVLLQGEPITAGFTDFVNTVLRGWDRATVHAVLLTGVVLVSLFIANTRAAYYFVLALVSPREVVPVAPSAPQPAVVPAAAATSSGYTVRIGPLVATVEPGVAVLAPVTATPATPVAGSGPVTATPAPEVPVAAETAREANRDRGVPVPAGTPARIGATIGALERLLVVVLVLTGAEAAVGLVIAAKTIARFRQLDDRGFAEYYLLGTLASVSVAIVTALVALAALQTLG